MNQAATDGKEEIEQGYAGIPCTTYHYLELAPAARYLGCTYKMCGISVASCPSSVWYRITPKMQSNSLSNPDEIAEIQLFNHIFIPESNAACIRLVFYTLSVGSFTCAFTDHGTLRVLSHDPGATWKPEEIRASGLLKDPPVGDADTFLANSIYTILHDYVQTRRSQSSYFHAGISFCPSGTLFVPLWLSSYGLSRMVDEWRFQLLPIAQKESIITIRLLSGQSSVRHVVQRPTEKHSFIESEAIYAGSNNI